MGKIITFTGHRPEGLYGTNYMANGNRQALLTVRQIIEDKIVNEGADIFYTGMARGFDQWAARIVIALRHKYTHIKLIAVLPCLRQDKKWAYEDKRDYGDILELCDDVNYLNFKEYYDGCMIERDHYMVNHCDEVIALFNGQKRSGTSATINHAKRQGKPLTIVKLQDLSIEYFDNQVIPV